MTPHVAQIEKGKGRRGSAIDRVTTRHPGYAASQKTRKRIEQVFGWLKTTACFRKTRYIGIAKTQFFALMTGAAYNLVRLARLALAPA